MKFLFVMLLMGVAEAHRAPLYRANAEDAIVDNYVVVFEEVSDVLECIEEVINHPIYKIGFGEISYIYTHAIGGFAGVLPIVLLNVVRRFPFVKYIQEDQVVRADAVASWGLDRIDNSALAEDDSFDPRRNGTGVNVYVIDSGINPSHTDFSGRAVTNSSIDFCKAPNNGIDCYGHGTHCAGIAGGDSYGVAKDVNIIAVRVLNCNGIGISSRTIKAMDWVAANHTKPAVVSISFGLASHQATDDAAAGIVNAGVPVVCSAGNKQQNVTNHSPAREPSVITVGAMDKQNDRAYFSNYGELVDILAPGVGIRSAWYTSDTAMKGKAGTSMAAPHVTGAVAIILADDPTMSPENIANKLADDSSEGMVSDDLTNNRVVYVGPL